MHTSTPSTAKQQLSNQIVNDGVSLAIVLLDHCQPLERRIGGRKPSVEERDRFLDSSRSGSCNEVRLGLRMHGIADVIDVGELT